MKFHVYGSCAGTEPIAGWHHLSFSLQHEGNQYFFDAGENCAYSAYTAGVDIAHTRRVVISHTHMDHVGGLANLLWYVRKLATGLHMETCPVIDIHIPCIETFEGIMKILKNTEGDFKCNFKIIPHGVCEGVVFCDGDLCVKAYPTTHLPKDADGNPRAFSYLIEKEGKKVFFTGDYGAVSDFAEVFRQNEIDLLLIETGHHSSEKTAKTLLEAGFFPKKLAYIHNGKDVRNDPENAISVTEKILGVPTVVLTDGCVFEV
ncbi:MAG: MBL fold metallo-hydrolase [Clostridia bacterium]|nr:MBL fold metallo-hydrolase [Clostridia bacterium]